MFTERVYSGADARRASRKIACRALLVLGAGATAAPVAHAQADRDSLAIRLRRAEEAIAVLQQQLTEQAGSAVQTRSRIRMEWRGRVAMNGFGNSRRVNNVDNPQFVRPDTTSGLPVRGVGISARQTRLGFDLSASDVLGGSFAADVDIDFYGGQQPSSGGRTFPLVRLRTARARLAWSRADLLIGQESPLVSGVDPVTPAAIGTPAFAAAGNLWLWLPQIRLGVHTAGALRAGLQAAVLAPTSGDAVGAFDTDYDLAERSQRPYLQGRAFLATGNTESPREIGCGVHAGWLVPVTARESSTAFTCDALVTIVDWIDVRGEFFAGQALRGLGGGGIGQNFTAGNLPLRTRGGWAQLNLRPASLLRTGAGCGGDHPNQDAPRRRNDACAVYAILRPAGPLFVGAEVRRIRTGYSTARLSNDHVTLAAGFEF